MNPQGRDVSFSGVYTPEDARKARWALRRTDRRGYLGGVIGLVLVLLPFMASPPIRGLNAAIILASGLCVLFLFWVQPELRVGADWRRLNKQVPVSGWLRESGVELRWDGSESTVSWTHFRSSRATQSLILLEDATGHPTYFPRAFFATDDDWITAVELVRSRVASSNE